MAIFIELKKHFAFLGIKPDGQSHWNIKNKMIVFIFACCFITLRFNLFESKSLMNFESSFYGAAGGVYNIITFSSNVVKRTRIFGLFDRLEDMIAKRRFHPSAVSLDLLKFLF